MRYKNGIPDYDSLTPEAAQAELDSLPEVGAAAAASHGDWGGPLEAHLYAHQAHRDRLASIAAQAQAQAQA